ncbi:hypothetical protein G195_001111 [Phytophthora kernoviae 00238/432]|uniref:Uncharacterized protein n=1 Tax=Phytophthora kernoviae 00238/432 TaxID=1284355 RepID=A0A8J4SBX2_9STRA|nr:hypothetical protein G195_001111 [Phytophthora kernoviae 00238/432]
MFFPNQGFQEAKMKYEKLHPNIEIKLETAYTDDAHSEADEEKFVKNMNTAMLAGKGPDLLQSAEYMNILPTDNYEGPLHGMEIKVDQAKLDQLESLVGGANHQVEYKSAKVQEMIVKESKAFFAGQKSADDVAKLIQNKHYMNNMFFSLDIQKLTTAATLMVGCIVILVTGLLSIERRFREHLE